jgi:mannose-1-phosphate guanylyltransferase
MVLAAGQGTRLRPLTEATPKPMVPIGNIPLLERTLRWLAREGVKDVMINVHHKPRAITDYVGNGRLFGTNVSYSKEDVLLGTAGAVKKCQDYFGSDPFLVIYGDNLLEVSLRPLVHRLESSSADAVLGLFTAPDPTACGLVLTEPDGRIIKFQEKPAAEEVFTDQANAGVYLLTSKVFNYIPEETPYDFGKQVFPEMLKAGLNLNGILLNGYLQDTGTPQSYRQANNDAIRGKVSGLRGKLVANDPNFTLIGEQARVSPNVSFHGINIIGPRTVIGAGSELTNTIIWEDVVIPDESQLTGAIIGAGAKLASGHVEEDSLVV